MKNAQFYSYVNVCPVLFCRKNKNFGNLAQIYLEFLEFFRILFQNNFYIKTVLIWLFRFIFSVLLRTLNQTIRKVCTCSKYSKRKRLLIWIIWTWHFHNAYRLIFQKVPFRSTQILLRSIPSWLLSHQFNQKSLNPLMFELSSS